ncbi:MFS transporter, partial [Streptococcus suis]
PISGSFLLMLPTMQIIKSYKTEEEKRYFIIQAIFSLFTMTLTYSVGIWLGQIKPLVLILPAGFALAILYRLYFKTGER